ncbi:hypothetical protein RB195_015160 [Necator americanus]|uniref:Uncharacterized protein n=1 Tax=Necator americanus TaxID=51031 RepID=A0ABR1E3A1_NECAM
MDTPLSRKLTSSTIPLKCECDDEISPAFKFDTGCYFYAVDVTLKNGRRLIAATEEKCYTFFSPSFLVLYTCATLIFITLVGFVYMVRERRKEQINMKEKTITGDHTGTESLVKMPARTLKRPKTKGQPERHFGHLVLLGYESPNLNVIRQNN